MASVVHSFNRPVIITDIVYQQSIQLPYMCYSDRIEFLPSATFYHHRGPIFNYPVIITDSVYQQSFQLPYMCSSDRLEYLPFATFTATMVQSLQSFNKTSPL